MKWYKIFFGLALVFLLQKITAQETSVIDSLWNVYQTNPKDSIKLKAANFLAFHYIFKTPERADSILQSASVYAKKNQLNFNLVELTNTRGIYYDVLSQKDSSKAYFKKALQLSRQYKYPTIEVMCINNLGMFCWNNGQFKEALDYFYEALEFSYEYNPNSEKGISVYLNNIGLIHQELSQYEKAIPYHEKALQTRIKFELTKDIAGSYNNLAICHKSLGELELAEKYINLAILNAQKANQPMLYHQFHDNLGNILNLQQKYTLAEEAYLVALEMPEEYQNFKRHQFTTYSNLIDVYNNTNQFEEAQAAINTAKSLLEEDPALYNFSEAYYFNSAKTYFSLQQKENANAFFDGYLQLKDSLFSQENVKAIAQVEAQLKTKEKEAELAQTKAELLEKELKVKQQNVFLYGSISAIIILLVISYLIIRAKQLKNNEIIKEAELQTALAKIELKNRLEEERLRISRDLHDNIGSQLTFVISGLQFIHYQKNLKAAEIKTKLAQISEFTQETIHELRDTIWAMNKEKIELDELINRLRNFISRLNISEDIKISTSEDLKHQLHDLNFTAIQGIQIYRIIQESINNAIKHAESQHIKISFDLKKEMLEVSIEDDGKGFETSTIASGNGLQNMENRAQKLKAQLAIESTLDKGTSIRIQLSIHPKNK